MGEQTFPRAVLRRPGYFITPCFFPYGFTSNPLCVRGFSLVWVSDFLHQKQYPDLSPFPCGASFQVLRSEQQGLGLSSASSVSQRPVYLSIYFFFKAFSFPVAQQLLTHPGSCWQLLLLSTLAILAAAFELRVVGTNAEP